MLAQIFFLSPKKYNYTFIKLGKDFKKIKLKQCQDFFLVDVGAGVNIFALNNFLKTNGVSGLEWSYGIPGTVGGAVIMNAGSFGYEFGEFVSAVKVLKNNKAIWVKDFFFDYRNSSFKMSNEIVLECRLKLMKGFSKDIEEKQQNAFNKKKLTQPYSENSAGSVFKHIKIDDKIYYPAKIIDNIGLKGVKIGGAEISEKHSGFIITKNAKATDVLKLIKFTKKEIKKKTNLVVKEEIIII